MTTRDEPGFARPAPIRFGADGLVPAVIQEQSTGVVLMLGYMNEEALRLTRETGLVHFFSRSRGKLWRKGETSGHVQRVIEIFVNCEQNSLLISVEQTGAVCHDGYATCYYRRLEADERLRVVRERVFDPGAVYGDTSADSASRTSPADLLAEATALQFGAYSYLRDHDLAARSGTSARLRAADDQILGRIADELIELAGALDGSHRHTDPAADVLLEAGQALYWVLLACVRAGATWREVRPDLALLTSEAGIAPNAIAAMLRAEAARWAGGPPAGDLVAAGHATLALVGQACRAAEIVPLAVVESDLAALRDKPYLAGYFLSRPTARGG